MVSELAFQQHPVTLPPVVRPPEGATAPPVQASRTGEQAAPATPKAPPPKAPVEQGTPQVSQPSPTSPASLSLSLSQEYRQMWLLRGVCPPLTPPEGQQSPLPNIPQGQAPLTPTQPWPPAQQQAPTTPTLGSDAASSEAPIPSAYTSGGTQSSSTGASSTQNPWNSIQLGARTLHHEAPLRKEKGSPTEACVGTKPSFKAFRGCEYSTKVDTPT